MKGKMAPQPKKRVRGPTRTPTPHHDWKSSPVIVAGGSAAAATLLCITVFTQIVVPTQTAQLENEALKAAEKARQLQERDKATSNLLASYKTKNLALERQVSSLSKEILAARLGSLFPLGNPYPSGLGRVKVGSPISALQEEYRGLQITPDPDDPTKEKVELKNSPFDSISYSYEAKDSAKRVIHISFHLKNEWDYEDSFMLKHIVEALGPATHQQGKSNFMWDLEGGSNAFLLGNTYMVMTDNVQPLLWRD